MWYSYAAVLFKYINIIGFQISDNGNVTCIKKSTKFYLGNNKYLHYLRGIFIFKETIFVEFILSIKHIFVLVKRRHDLFSWCFIFVDIFQPRNKRHLICNEKFIVCHIPKKK